MAVMTMMAVGLMGVVVVKMVVAMMVVCKDGGDAK
jgi:hypothetical protein